MLGFADVDFDTNCIAVSLTLMYLCFCSHDGVINLHRFNSTTLLFSVRTYTLSHRLSPTYHTGGTAPVPLQPYYVILYCILKYNPAIRSLDNFANR